MRWPRAHGLSARDLVADAMSSIAERPVRSLLTSAGTILGVGTVVAVLGLTATAGNQISRTFTEASATEVAVSEVPDPATVVTAFPADATDRVERIAGVEAAGVTWPLASVTEITGSPVTAPPTAGVDVTVVAADPGYFRAAGAIVREGVLPNEMHEQTAAPVAVLGEAAARRLGIGTVVTHPVVTLDGVPVHVVGIIDGAVRRPELARAVIVTTAFARQTWSAQQTVDAAMLVVARPGAAVAVAGQIALAVRPDAPQLILVAPPPDPRRLRADIESSVSGLLLVLAMVSLAAGAFGIANTALVSVMERTSEIGLRRALGAQRSDIAGEFLLEAAVVGLLGGVVGSACAVVTVLVTSVAREWTAVLDPRHALLGPAIGAAVGALCGLYPALRAAGVEPVRALRS